MARSVTLQQTVELVRQTIAVAEEQLPLAGRARHDEASCARSCCGSAARSPSPPRVSTPGPPRAAAPGTPGSRRWSSTGWCAALDVARAAASQLAALGWRSTGPVDRGGRVGTRRRQPTRCWPRCTARLDAAATWTRWPGCTAARLVVVLGGVDDPLDAARLLLPAFGDGPVVVGPSRRRHQRRQPGDARRAVRPARGAWLARRAATGQRRRAAARARAGRRRRRARRARRQRLPAAGRGRRRPARDGRRLPRLAAARSRRRLARCSCTPTPCATGCGGSAEVCGEAPTDPRGAFVLQVRAHPRPLWTAAR